MSIVKGGKQASAITRRQATIVAQQIFDDKTKRDAVRALARRDRNRTVLLPRFQPTKSQVDELEHRPKQPLFSFVSDFFTNRHGIPELAAKNLAGFQEGIQSTAFAGNRRSLAFALLAGYIPFDGDTVCAISEPSACTFYLELERKATRAAGVDSERSDGAALMWLPLDRAVELLRNEFRYARTSETSKWALEVVHFL